MSNIIYYYLYYRDISKTSANLALEYYISLIYFYRDIDTTDTIIRKVTICEKNTISERNTISKKGAIDKKAIDIIIKRNTTSKRDIYVISEKDIDAINKKDIDTNSISSL